MHIVCPGSPFGINGKRDGITVACDGITLGLHFQHGEDSSKAPAWAKRAPKGRQKCVEAVPGQRQSQKSTEATGTVVSSAQGTQKKGGVGHKKVAFQPGQETCDYAVKNPAADAAASLSPAHLGKTKQES